MIYIITELFSDFTKSDQNNSRNNFSTIQGSMNRMSLFTVERFTSFQLKRKMSSVHDSFQSLHSHLRQTYPAPLLPPGRPNSKQLTPRISALELHPTLEAGLHILNNDLPAAHFLVRKMQSLPASEGMFLHGILHRIEGDFDNARCWYSDIQHDSEVYAKVWGNEGKHFKDIREELGDDAGDGEWMPYRKGGGQEGEMNAGQRFLNDVQSFKGGKVKNGEVEARLEKESRREFDVILGWCAEKFGTGAMVDASSAWVQDDDAYVIRSLMSMFVPLGEGWADCDEQDQGHENGYAYGQCWLPEILICLRLPNEPYFMRLLTHREAFGS